MKNILFLVVRFVILNLIIFISWNILGIVHSLLENSEFRLLYFSIEAFIVSILLCNIAYLTGTGLALLHNKWWKKEESHKQIEAPYFKGSLVLLIIILASVASVQFFN